MRLPVAMTLIKTKTSCSKYSLEYWSCCCYCCGCDRKTLNRHGLIKMTPHPMQYQGILHIHSISIEPGIQHESSIAHLPVLSMEKVLFHCMVQPKEKILALEFAQRKKRTR